MLGCWQLWRGVGAGGGGRYVGRAMVEAVLGGVAQSPDQSCSSVHPPADLLTTPHRRAAPHHYIHTYTVTQLPLVRGASSNGGKVNIVNRFESEAMNDEPTQK